MENSREWFDEDIVNAAMYDGLSLTPAQIESAWAVWQIAVKRANTQATGALYQALDALVTLKESKDANGKTPEYEANQPKAWEAARAALSKAERRLG